MFEGKKILITGGTGSLGQALTKRLLQSDVDTIRIFSRNENKLVKMESEFADDRLRFLIGDVRDLPRLIKALEDVDIVYHAAALKHVPVIEYNPFEAIKTNVVGSQNVIDACLHENVETAREKYEEIINRAIEKTIQMLEENKNNHPSSRGNDLLEFATTHLNKFKRPVKTK